MCKGDFNEIVEIIKREGPNDHPRWEMKDLDFKGPGSLCAIKEREITRYRRELIDGLQT